jgi:hypothetical protein
MRGAMLILALLALPASAADELLTPGEQVQRELRAALAARNEDRAVALLAEVGGLYRYPASEAEAEALLRLAAEAARVRSSRIAVAALRALGETGSRKAAAHVEPFLRDLKPAAGEEARMVAAIQAAGQLREPGLVTPLLKLAKGSSDLVVAEQAFFALGEYAATDVALRKSVADRTLAVCEQASRRRGRWRRLRAPGLRALQQLIGRRLNSVTMFEIWWKVAKDRKDPFAPPVAERK